MVHSTPAISVEDQKPTPAQGRLVKVLVGVSVLLFVLMGYVLATRSLKTRLPDSVLAIQGTEAFRTASIVVEGSTLTIPLRTSFDVDKKYLATIFLNPGQYTLTISMNGLPMLRRDVYVEASEWLPIDLSGKSNERPRPR